MSRSANLAGSRSGRAIPARSWASKSRTIRRRGGLGHALPYLWSNFALATALAAAVVLAELAAIAWVRHRWMDTPWLSATLQVVLGGAVVFAVGVLIGSS
jgi:hypothetical protein